MIDFEVYRVYQTIIDKLLMSNYYNNELKYLRSYYMGTDVKDKITKNEIGLASLYRDKPSIITDYLMFNYIMKGVI